MSPWNIISKFRSKRGDVATSDAPQPVPQKVEPIQPVSDQDAAIPLDVIGIGSEPETGRVSVRLTVHEIAETAVTTMVEQPEFEAPKSDGIPQAFVGQKHEMKAQPSYDIRPSTRTSKQSRVSLSSVKPKAALQNKKKAQAEEVEGYLTSVVGLDDDIKQLRAALAQKLETQNGQLRVMLSRFDLAD
jgi:hypothetical protein